MYLDRQVWANSVDPDQMLQNAASDQGLHCWLLIQQFLNTLTGNLFVCVQVLKPSVPNGVMSSLVSLPNYTFTGQA